MTSPKVILGCIIPMGSKPILRLHVGIGLSMNTIPMVTKPILRIQVGIGLSVNMIPIVT